MVNLSESFYITISGVGISGIALFLWYFKSTLITSRCTEIMCCWGCCKIENKVLSDEATVEVNHETPPTIMSNNGQRTPLNSKYIHHDHV